MFSWKRQIGVTILEIMLVAVIGGIVVMLGMRQYVLFRNDADAQQVRSMVDSLFVSMQRYYRANCHGGNFNPATGPLQNPLPINIRTDLIAGGFFDDTNKPLNPIVLATGGDWATGFIIQYNEYLAPSRVCTGGSTPPAITGPSPSQNCSTPRTIATIVTWIPQVSVRLNTANAVTRRAMLRQLGGDCLSSAAGSYVTPCSGSGPGTGDYVVFMRAATAAGINRSPYWTSMPNVKQFSDMYTQYQVNYSIDSGGMGGGLVANQYYLCGY